MTFDIGTKVWYIGGDPVVVPQAKDKVGYIVAEDHFGAVEDPTETAIVNFPAGTIPGLDHDLTQDIELIYLFETE